MSKRGVTSYCMPYWIAHCRKIVLFTVRTKLVVLRLMFKTRVDRHYLVISTREGLLYVAISTGRRNTYTKSFCWRLKVSLSRIAFPIPLHRLRMY